VDLAQLSAGSQDERFAAGMRELVAIAHGHLRNALDYTLLIPAKEKGIRRFCLWAIGLAILTLRKIAQNPGFTSGAQVKVKRSAVSTTVLMTNLFVGNDWMLRRLFALAARGVPLLRVPELRRPKPALIKNDDPEWDAAREPEPAMRRSYGGSGS
jgi:farnesyl-diphosphate farnesyltransferase